MSASWSVASLFPATKSSPPQLQVQKWRVWSNWCTVRYPYWLSTENTRKSFITHALVSKVVSFSSIAHHFPLFHYSGLCASILYFLYYFIYYKNPMYTTFSVVESSTPPTHQSSSPPSFVKFSPVVVVSFSPPVVKSYQVPLTKSTQFTFTFTHAQSSSREAIYVQAQFMAHKEHPSSQPTPQPSVSTVPQVSFSSYLRRPLGYSHRPSHNTNPENQSLILRPSGLSTIPGPKYIDKLTA